MEDYKIIIKNQSSTLDNNLYNRLKPIIHKQVEDCLRGAKLNIVLYVKIVDSFPFSKGKTQKAAEAAATLIQNKNSYTLLIKSKELIHYEQGHNILDVDIYHELAHAYDMEQIKKHCSLTRPIKITSYNDYFYNMGEFFWTEVFAYYQTFDAYPTFESESFYSLIKKIKHINKFYKSISTFNDKEKEVMLDDLLVDFEYFCARYIGARFANTVKLKSYKDKTVNDLDFKFVTIFIKGTFKYLIKLFKGYKKSTQKTLIELGKYIFIRLYCMYGYRLSFTKNKKVILVRIFNQK